MQNRIKRRLFNHRNAIGFGLLGIMLFTPTLSFGWGAGGHMMIASIAYDRLNPRAKAKAKQLLAIQIPPAAITLKSLNFINAAHWADDLRPFSEFDQLKELHFIDAPFSTDGTPLPELPTPNIVTALEENVEILRTSRDKDAQARALRLIIHFVGDIHQPLHCATQVDGRHPQGDRGGNLVSIMISGTSGKLQKSNLHSYWDGGIGTFPKTGVNFAPPPLSEIRPATVIAMKGNSDSALGLKLDDPFNYGAWADESLQYAKTVAYKDNKSTKLAASYSAASLRVVRERVSWAGYRLAALLNSIWP